jgi:hypothetical protein
VRDNLEIVAHEFLHLMGLIDAEKGGPSDGRMKYTAIPPDFKLQPVSNTDVQEIINYAISNDGKIDKKADPNGGANASISQTGNGNIKDAKKIEVK